MPDRPDRPGRPMTDIRIERSEATPERPTFLELLFDLVYVFALTRISQRLIRDLTTEGQMPFAEGVETLLLFLTLWITWASTTWATSRLDPDVPVVRVVLLITMVGSMVMAVAVPHGFGERAVVFAGAHVAVQVARTAYYGIATRRLPQGRFATRSLVWSVLSGALWIAGALAPSGPPRGWLWAGALLLEYIGWAWGSPVPRLGRDRLGTQPIAGGHLAERYQQFLLIALGEVIFTVGLAFSESPFDIPQAAGFALGLAGTMLFWQIYFFRAGQLLGEAIGGARRPPQIGFAVAFTHLPMIAGIVLAGVGYELIVADPLGELEPAWLLAILGGPALFLIGRAPLEFQVFGRISRSRLAGLVALGALAPALLHVPPLAAGAVATGVLLGVAASDLRRARGREPEPAAPPP
ncbi:low temperature requirement protein A [Micromonospora sp. NPDC094482]|uniref:low temperature requirement protein A n=1 Tax=unclassified Micromonospora TaxID=2617518 RepID=UPI00331DA720